MASGSCVSSASSSPCGIENGLWLKSTPLQLLVIFEHREVDDPAELEAAFLDQPQFLGNASTRCAGQFRGVLLLAGGKEQSVIFAQAQFGIELFHTLGAVVLGDRTAEIAAPCG